MDPKQRESEVIMEVVIGGVKYIPEKEDEETKEITFDGYRNFLVGDEIVAFISHGGNSIVMIEGWTIEQTGTCMCDPVFKFVKK